MLRKFFTTTLFTTLLLSHSAFSEQVIQLKGSEQKRIALFAMGCFWCGAAAFAEHDTNKKFPGVLSIKSGYAGGTLPNPTYQNHVGYIEAVKIEFDPKVISYEQLLDIFWHNIDPFDARGQFCDKGPAYVSALFYVGEEQRQQAEASKARVEKLLGKKTVTKVIAATTFYDAEDYHQDYKIKNPINYKYYRWSCGRDAR